MIPAFAGFATLVLAMVAGAWWQRNTMLPTCPCGCNDPDDDTWDGGWT